MLSNNWLSGSSAGAGSGCTAPSLGEAISRYLGAPAPPMALTRERLGTEGRWVWAYVSSNTGLPRRRSSAQGESADLLPWSGADLASYGVVVKSWPKKVVG